MKKFLIKVINTESRLVEVHSENEKAALEKAKDGIGNFIIRPIIETEAAVVATEDPNTIFSE